MAGHDRRAWFCEDAAVHQLEILFGVLRGILPFYYSNWIAFVGWKGCEVAIKAMLIGTGALPVRIVIMDIKFGFFDGFLRYILQLLV